MPFVLMSLEKLIEREIALRQQMRLVSEMWGKFLQEHPELNVRDMAGNHPEFVTIRRKRSRKPLKGIFYRKP